MKLLLIRHGESTGNRDHIWAGITDNELTNHGFLQASKLGAYLEKLYGSHEPRRAILSIYCSDLLRAHRTANEIAKALGKELVVTKLLREQDLGWREGRSISKGHRDDVANAIAMKESPGESKSDMDLRALTFINQHLKDSIEMSSPTGESEESILVIVSHGLFLLRLYGQLMLHLKVNSPPPVSWSNTGCTTIRVFPNGTGSVIDINSTQHLIGLKRTRAGVGSSQYDTKQQKVSAFFTSPRSKGREPNYSQDALRESKALKEPQVLNPSNPIEDDDLQAQIAAIDAACNSKDT
jgi:probable phosphoglycerate mutase